MLEYACHSLLAYRPQDHLPASEPLINDRTLHSTKTKEIVLRNVMGIEHLSRMMKRRKDA